MKETELPGKVRPSHPDILSILEEIREKYQIPPIAPHDDSLKELLKYGLDSEWETNYTEILEKVVDRSLGWCPLYRDPYAVIFVRRGVSEACQ